MAQERVDSLFASESWTAVYTAFTNVSLKAYDFDTIREALLKYVAETYPQKFNDFIASSEFIAILDLVAYLGHSLSFRNDMNTRENFMDTAERRESILRMAKTLGYNKTRPINARGFMKITSVRTNQAVFDSNGVSLSNRSIVWNDTNNVDWYENFVTVLNAAFTKESSVENPSNAMTNLNIENFLHVVNENSANSSVKFPFNANIGGKSRNFEAVRAEFDGNSIVESDPNIASKMTFVQRSDGLGPASDRTGFFVLAKAGSLKFRDFNFDTKLSNRIQKISDINISNSDVWVHKITTSGDFVSKVQKVDNDTRETAIYHTLKDRNADIVRVGSLEDNAIDLTFSDGVFGNAAYGAYRVWYRTADNENFSVEQNDIKNVDISIPYIGSDNREYRLTVSMKSTTDFSENFEGENYLSVKRIAPRSYYAQDRMVNAQDYNVLPLTLGTNVVKKVKAVNTSHAGKSRYFEMDDVTGNHSNVHVNGTDGSLYFDADEVKITLPFNKANGNINHFLKYELSTVLKHPAMINNFYNVTFNDPKYDFRGVLDAWERDATDLLKGTIVNTSTLPIEEGDSLLIVDTNEENGVWCKVVKVTTTGAFILDRIAPNGYVIQLVKSPRLKFNDAEIDTIKNYVVSENYTKPFYLWYDTYAWSVWYDGIENDIDDPSLDEDYAESLLKVKVEYKQGFRSLDSEFVCTIEGTKIVFDSRDDVKFFYNNEGPVVDQKTSLEKRDKIFINYYSDKVNVEGLNVISTPSQITLGKFEMNNVVYDNQTDVLDFDVEWCCSGAHQNFEFVNLHPEFSEVTFEHQLVNTNGCTAYTIPSPTDTVIGTSTDCTPYAFTVSDASTYLLDEEAISNDVTVVSTVDYEISNVEMSVTGGTGNTGNAAWATITVSSNDLSLQGLNGDVSTSYLQDAVNNGKFFFFDESEIAPKTSQTVVSGDAGTVTPYLIEYDENTDMYTFTLPENQTIIGEDDADAYWKQIGLSEYTFTFVGPLTLPTDIAVKVGESFVNQSHYEITSLGNDQYKIVFWTAVPETSVISIFKVSGGSSFNSYDLRVIAKFNFISQIQVQTQKYEVAETFISEKFSTPMGYVDYSKVKLSPSTNDGNPYGMIEVIRDTKVDNNPEIILEKYTDENNVVYERVSTNAVATATKHEILDMPNIWFDQTNEEWQRKTNGDWSIIIPNYIDGVRHVIIDNIEYRVVEGKSSVEDRYMSFRWDHYADENKRIDPSTSNVIDVYLLTSDYVNSVNSWIASGFVGSMPTPPNNYELTNLMSGLLPKASISDHVSFIPSKFKLLFGENASPENQATFKVVKRGGTNYTDSEIKTQVSQKINEYFNIDNWDFGESFYFSELAAYLHTELSDMISSVVMAPKYSSGDFKKLLSISSDPNEVLLGTTTSKDIKIIASISDSELAGE